MYYFNHYVIDWEKVQTLDDLKRIMQTIDITFEPNHPDMERIKDLIRLEPKQIEHLIRLEPKQESSPI